MIVNLKLVMSNSAKTKIAQNVSCEERARQFPKGTLHADGGKLFCSICNITVDHTRKSTIDRHLKSEQHSSKRKLNEEKEDNKVKRQMTVTSLFDRHTAARDARNVAVFDLVEVWTEANIPLEKLDHPRLHSYLQVFNSYLHALSQFRRK